MRATLNRFGPFDGGACLQVIQSALAQNWTLRWDYELFLNQFREEKQDISVTLKGCESFCDEAYRVPPNSGPRLLSWFLPILLLIGSNRYPDDVKWNKNIKTAAFILSNPILANLVILSRLDARHYLSPPELLRPRTLYAYTVLLIYVWQVISAFVEVIGGAPKPSGGMLGPALLLSWLIPMVLASNAVGEEAFHDPSDECDIIPLARVDRYLKNADLGRGRWTVRVLLIIAPVCISVASAFRVLYTKPTFLTCRHFLIAFIFGVWLLNFVVTMVALRLGQAGRFSRGLTRHFITLKDILLAALIITLLVGTTLGLFTSCYCLSGRWNYSVPRVYVFPDAWFKVNLKEIYPITVFLSFGLQYLLYQCTRCIWRREFTHWELAIAWWRILLFVRRVKSLKCKQAL